MFDLSIKQFALIFLLCYTSYNVYSFTKLCNNIMYYLKRLTKSVESQNKIKNKTSDDLDMKNIFNDIITAYLQVFVNLYSHNHNLSPLINVIKKYFGIKPNVPFIYDISEPINLHNNNHFMHNIDETINLPFGNKFTKYFDNFNKKSDKCNIDDINTVCI